MRSVSVRHQLAITTVLLSLLSFDSSAQILEEYQKILASDGSAGDFFGQAVDIDQDTIIVSSRLDDDNGEDSGSAYFFVRKNGIWAEQQKVTASDGSAGDEFGFSVAIQGDTAVIGVFKDADNGPSSGSAWVFVRTAGVWSELQKLTASDAENFDNFGGSVAIEGDTIVVGALGAGAAYVFTNFGGFWVETQILTPSDGETSFANTVRVDGDTIVVGAFLDDTAAANAGSVYVYERSMGVWNETQELTASDFAAGDNFGGSVDVDEATIMAGAILDDDNGDNSGSAYAFEQVAGMWGETQKLTSSDAVAGDFFGGQTRLDGNDAVVGATSADVGASESGTAYAFKRNAGLWSETFKLIASDGDVFDLLSIGLALDNGTVVAGVRQDDDLGAESGSAYIYLVNKASIDIRPFTAKNRVIPGSKWKIPVAILGSIDFDVFNIDPGTVRLGPRGGRAKRNVSIYHDINLDGFTDLTLLFRTSRTGIACGDTEARLFGLLSSGDAFFGVDSIQTVFCKAK